MRAADERPVLGRKPVIEAQVSLRVLVGRLKPGIFMLGIEYFIVPELAVVDVRSPSSSLRSSR
jgi:hypothetical protein